MALRIWLPLNGSLDNQGLSNLKFIEQGNVPSLTLDGKIGSTYTRDSTHNGFFVSNTPINLGTNVTMCAWVNPTFFYSGASLTGIFGQHRHSTNSGLGVNFKYVSDTTGYLTCSTGNGSSRTYNTYCGTTLLTAGNWYHVGLTYDSSTIKLYVNGKLDKEVTYTDQYNIEDYIYLYAWSLSGSTNNVVYNDYTLNGKLNDVRIYDECLSPKQMKEISKGLVAHYKLDGNFNNRNLIINGYGELGTMGWDQKDSSHYSTDVPSGNNYIKQSICNTWTDNLIPWNVKENYYISLYLKAVSGATSNTYPSLAPYDVDGKFIEYYKCASGFATNTATTLSQELKPGDTVIHATSLSAWDTGTNYYYHVAIFGYVDSEGTMYPDLSYTQDSPVFGTRTDKSHIDKTNNTITLNSAYTGAYRPAGTKICQATEGSTYWYPFGGVSPSAITDWTFKETTFRPDTDVRLKYSKYVKFLCYSNAWYAGITLKNVTSTDASGIEPDNSGYGYHGIISGLLGRDPTTGRDSKSTVFSGVSGSTTAIKIPLNDMLGMSAAGKVTYSISCWFKVPEAGAKTYGTLLGGQSGYEIETRTNDSPALPKIWAYSWGGGKSSEYSWNEWHHLVAVFDAENDNSKWYIDGALSFTGTMVNIPMGDFFIGAWKNNASQNYNGSLSDFRIYATALTAEDVLTLYKNSGIIDNEDNVYTYEFVENKNNLMRWINNAVIDKNFVDGLNRYQQTNCQVTAEDEGIHIYRPPNIVHNSSTMHNMWGGLNISINSASYKDHLRDNLLKGHKYIILFDAKGQTSKAQTSIGWTNQMGWGGGGLSPNPSNVEYRAIPANFQSDDWQTFFYKWDLTDDVYKVCTSSYSGFVQGTTYLSYRDFMVGWGYENTESLGTDIYIRNIRMYDITDNAKPKLIKTGVLNIDGIHENDKTRLRKNELEATSFIEI